MGLVIVNLVFVLLSGEGLLDTTLVRGSKRHRPIEQIQTFELAVLVDSRSGAAGPRGGVAAARAMGIRLIVGLVRAPQYVSPDPQCK
jgi:hypothetical protein